MKPILFNTEMVQANLDLRKNSTRRLLKGYALEHLQIDTDGSVIGVYDQHEGCVRPVTDYAPYQPGDILYVRETWRVRNVYGDFKYGNRTAEIEFKAGGEYVYMRVQEDAMNDRRWRPSIHMPKEAARLFLRVTDVRVERLQDISVEDAKKEGVFHACGMCAHWHDYCGKSVTMARDCKIYGIAPEFPRLWDSTIKPADLTHYGWNANPWVWVIEYELCASPKKGE